MRVLFVRFSATGDVVLTTGVLRYFHEKFPDWKIDVLTSVSGSPIIETLPFINRIYSVRGGSGPLRLIKKYRKIKNKYDHIFDLQDNFKTFLLQKVVNGNFHKIQKHSMERRAFVRSRKYKERLSLHVVEKYAKTCLDPFRLSTPEVEKLRPSFPDFKQHKVPGLPDGKFIAIHPYASQKNKEWPYFYDLINKLIASGLKIVVIGRGNNKWPKEVLDLTNKTNLEELFSVIAKSSAIITTDSGPLHVAIGFKKPALAIFGPTTKEFGFYPEFRKTVVVEDNDLKCRPCHVHGGNTCPQKHFQCMKNISVQEVFNNIHGLLLETKKF